MENSLPDYCICLLCMPSMAAVDNQTLSMGLYEIVKPRSNFIELLKGSGHYW